MYLIHEIHKKLKSTGYAVTVVTASVACLKSRGKPVTSGVTTPRSVTTAYPVIPTHQAKTAGTLPRSCCRGHPWHWEKTDLLINDRLLTVASGGYRLSSPRSLWFWSFQISPAKNSRRHLAVSEAELKEFEQHIQQVMVEKNLVRQDLRYDHRADLVLSLDGNWNPFL